jgi:hypothetical protein
MWYSVRRTRVLRIEETSSIEVEAGNEAQAIEQAEGQDDNLQWLQDEREITGSQSSATEIKEEAP